MEFREIANFILEVFLGGIAVVGLSFVVNFFWEYRDDEKYKQMATDNYTRYKRIQTIRKFAIIVVLGLLVGYLGLWG